MKPREELRDKIWTTLTHDGYSLKDKARIIEKHTDRIVIGRWVPVSERLPEFKGYYWSGYLIEDGVAHYDICSEQRFKSGDTTHWLELDIPEVSQ